MKQQEQDIVSSIRKREVDIQRQIEDENKRGKVQ